MRFVIVLELGESTTPDEMASAVADLQDLGYSRVRVADGEIGARILESINPPKR